MTLDKRGIYGRSYPLEDNRVSFARALLSIPRQAKKRISFFLLVDLCMFYYFSILQVYFFMCIYLFSFIHSANGVDTSWYIYKYIYAERRRDYNRDGTLQIECWPISFHMPLLLIECTYTHRDRWGRKEKDLGWKVVYRERARWKGSAYVDWHRYLCCSSCFSVRTAFSQRRYRYGTLFRGCICRDGTWFRAETIGWAHHKYEAAWPRLVDSHLRWHEAFSAGIIVLVAARSTSKEML